MKILCKQFSDKFYLLYFKPMNDYKIDNVEYNGSIEIFEEYKKNKKSKMSVSLRSN